MHVKAEIAAARHDIETAVAEAQGDPRLESIVERADELPTDMRGDAETAIGGQPEPVAEIPLIAGVSPADSSVAARLQICPLVLDALHTDSITRTDISRVFGPAERTFLPRDLRLPGRGVGIGPAASADEHA